MYFVESGTVSIQLDQENGENVEISVLETGAYFGELALVTHRPRAATAVALSEVRVACKFFTTISPSLVSLRELF